ncbi:MAG: hypothetical protein Q9160_008648 [Pyrenula sp. 1 TL-2023]
MDALVGNELEMATHLGTLIENREPGGVAMSSSIRTQFGNRYNVAGIKGQEGCTTIYVIAKGGLWAAHIWEEPALSRSIRDEFGEVLGQADPLQADFQRDVLNFIQNGDGPAYPGLAADCGAGRLFDFPNVLEILYVTPQVSESIPITRHDRRLARISALLNVLIPGVRPVIENYVPKNDRDPTMTDVDGTVVVQYTPTNPNPDNPHVRRPGVRIISQGKKLPIISWNPLPHQIRKRTHLQKRQNNDCRTAYDGGTALTTSVSPRPVGPTGGSIQPPPLSPPPTSSKQSSNPPSSSSTNTPNSPSKSRSLSPSASPSQSPPPETDPTLPKPSPALPERYAIRIHQQMDHSFSKLEWTLIDFSGDQLLPPSTSDTVPASDIMNRSALTIEVRNPTNKDKTDITFTLQTDAGQIFDGSKGCYPSWSTGTSEKKSGKGAKKFVCYNGENADYYCNGVGEGENEGWREWMGGFERKVDCFWRDLGHGF